jgi:radical SAM superfamily enzyme YgiQ (UPF0313 family)
LRICFVNPPLNYNKKNIFTPIGLVSIGSGLIKHGHEVEIVDLQARLVRGQIKPGSLYQDCLEILSKNQADLLAFTSLCSNYPFVLRLAEGLKKLNPQRKLILGGPHASLVARETLQYFPWIDVIARGEGEFVMPELVSALAAGHSLAGIKGITYRCGKQIIENRDRKPLIDLDGLPMPDYEHLYPLTGDITKYYVLIDTGRGCTGRCRFCSSRHYLGGRWRTKSPERVVAEIEYLKKRWGVERVESVQDLFTADKDYITRFCQLLIRKKIRVRWGASARIDSIDAEMLRLMAEAGCDCLLYGIESGSERIRGQIRKKLARERINRVLTQTLDQGIFAFLAFILGFPEEKIDDVLATLKLAAELKKMGGFVSIIPPRAVPRTELYQASHDRLVFVKDDPFLPYSLLSRDDLPLIKKRKDVFSYFYMLRPKYLPLRWLVDFYTRDVFKLCC